jgi:hypothetical protein
VGHLGEFVLLEAMGSSGVVVLCDTAALQRLRIARFRALPIAPRRMLRLIVNAMLPLFKRGVLVDLPHLKVVDFFHHRLPESNPRVNKPV